MEAPLRSLDSTFETFARQHGLSVSRNDRGWPERSIRWGHPVNRLIQLFLESEEHLSWTLWVCVSEDRASKRFWRHSSLRKAVPIAEINSDLATLLSEAWQIAEAWSSDDLEFATDLESPAV